MKYNIDEIRKIAEENKTNDSDLYENFIIDYIVPAAKKGQYRVIIKAKINKTIIRMLRMEGYIVLHHPNRYERTYDGFCMVPGTEYYEIGWEL